MAVRDQRADEQSRTPRKTVTGRPPTRRSTGTVTLSDVARHAGVSAQTVSRAIRMPQLVSHETLTRVRDSIDQTGYVPNLAASNLASNRSMTVAAIIPAINASVFADALHGLSEALVPAGYQLFIGATDYSLRREEELIRAFLGRRPDGIFIVGTEHTPAVSELLQTAQVPVVETWSMTDDPIHSVVGFSNTAAIGSIVEHVVDRGYRHPTFAGSMQSGDVRALERQHGFETAMARLLPRESVRVVSSQDGHIDFDAGASLVVRVLDEHPETDVLMFSSDVFAAGALFECARRGIDIPGRLAVTGFGDFEIARHIRPGLTTVSVPNLDIGLRAGELLLDHMTRPESVAQTIDLGFSIVSRESA